LIPVPVTSPHLQHKALLARILRISFSRLAPEYLDDQGTGTVTMIASVNAVLWRRIVTDRPPGILDAICKINTPKSEIVVGLLVRCALIAPQTDPGNGFGWIQIALQSIRIQTDLLSEIRSSNGSDPFLSCFGGANDADQQQGGQAGKTEGEYGPGNEHFEQAETGVTARRLEM
jgi:hypothetical protein